MASLLQLKRRIMAAQNVSKTTRAMQMIAASKLKRAQIAALSAKTYSEKLSTISKNVTKKIAQKNIHPYITSEMKNEKTMLIIISPDKGLCGGLITNLVKEFLDIQKKEYEYIVIGKKIESKIVHFSNNQVIATFDFGTTIPSFETVFPILKIIDEYFIKKQVSLVKVLYSSFSNIFSQVPKTETLLPISFEANENSTPEDYLFEPNITTLLPSLLKHYLEMSIYRILLESFASEQASRMIAMQNATTNAKEVIEELRLDYNKSRQAKITNEILDISNIQKEEDN